MPLWDSLVIAKTCLCCNRTSRSAGRNVGRKYGRDYGRHRGLIESRNASRDESRDVGHNVGLSLLVTGFREWPKGVERAEDADSGPIVSGIGQCVWHFGSPCDGGRAPGAATGIGR